MVPFFFFYVDKRNTPWYPLLIFKFASLIGSHLDFDCFTLVPAFVYWKSRDYRLFLFIYHQSWPFVVSNYILFSTIDQFEASFCRFFCSLFILEIFCTIHETHLAVFSRRFGTWPVAMLAQSKNKAVLEGPVCNGSEVIGWHTNEKSKRLRRFHVDMSGFAFNSTILWDPKRWHRLIPDPIRQLDSVKEGFQVCFIISFLLWLF